MNLSQWLEKLQTQHSKDWDLGLARVGEVGARLDVLKPAKSAILVAGTNGKGSTCAYLEAYCQSFNLTYGKTTSPHLQRYNEQVVINGQAVSDEALISAFKEIEAARQDISLSYFEFGALAAFILFKQHKIDVAIVEIGLGGRLDAMNIVEPDLSIITKIDLDHQDWLGDNREVIAVEKAGVMRAGKPVICVDEDPPRSIESEARRQKARLFQLGRDFHLKADVLHIVTAEEERHWQLPKTQLPLPSAMAATVAMVQLGYTIDQPTATQVLTDTALPGRYQRIIGPPNVILDVAHNPNAVRHLRKRLESEGLADLHVVIGMFRDKDHASIFQHLSPLVSTWHLVDLPGERGASAELLNGVLSDSCGLTGNTYGKVSTAMAAAISASQNTVLVMGSFVTIAAALDHFQHNSSQE